MKENELRSCLEKAENEVAKHVGLERSQELPRGQLRLPDKCTHRK